MVSIQDARAQMATSPSDAHILNFLGVIAASRSIFEACRWFKRALAIDASSVDARRNLAGALYSMNYTAQAFEQLRKAIASEPTHHASYYNSGTMLLASNPTRAAILLQRSMCICRLNVQGLKNLAVSLMRAGSSVAAMKNCRAAIAIEPSEAQIFYNLGRCLSIAGLHDESFVYCRRTLSITPSEVEAARDAGRYLQRHQRLDSAVDCFRRAIEHRPDHVGAQSDLGVALTALRRFGEALACFRRAASVVPNVAGALANVGAALANQGFVVDGVDWHRRALWLIGLAQQSKAEVRDSARVKEDNAATHSNFVFLLDLLPGQTFESHQLERRRWYEMHGAQCPGWDEPHRNDPDPNRKLRLGYISADFRHHSAAAVFGPILQCHDRKHFDVYCYSNVEQEDERTEGFRRIATKWRNIRGCAPAAVAAQVRGDGIDILVDLSSHSAGNQLLAFCQKPAPIQVSAWGYCTGTGIPVIDYLFADPVLIPENVRHLFAETVYDLPCFMTYQPPQYAPSIVSAPSTSSDAVIFGCFNRVVKISEETMITWSELFEEMPGARLVLKDASLDDRATRERLWGNLERLGISRKRVTLTGATPHMAHLEAYGGIDIALDPFPQNGGISTLEALWMGVPVIALLGASAPSRASASLLTAIGLPELIAHDAKEYVSLAARWSRRLEERQQLRFQLRELLTRSSVGNNESYTRRAETAFRALWGRWCASIRSRQFVLER